MSFLPPDLDLAPGESYRVELFVPAPGGKPAAGTLTLATGKGISVQEDTKFPSKLPAWGAKTYPTVTAAADAAGEALLTATHSAGGEATLRLNIVEPGVTPTPGDQRLTVRITNPFRMRPLIGRILAANPNQLLQYVTAREFRIPPSSAADMFFPLPGLAAAADGNYEFTLTLQSYQGYRSKRTFSLKFPAAAQ
jgi:hypothetical protein